MENIRLGGENPLYVPHIFPNGDYSLRNGSGNLKNKNKNKY
jgi:hypothetical protein